MEHKIHFSAFSQAEDSVYFKFQAFRDRLFLPLSVFLTKLGVKPNHLSYLNLLSVIFFAYFLTRFPPASFFILCLSVFLDSIDGCLARHQKFANERGALLDLVADHAVFLGVVLALIYTKTVDGFLGATYSLNYLFLVLIVIVMRNMKLNVFPIVRSKYYLYLIWAVFIFTGLNYLDIFLLFFTVYMFLTNLFLFHTFRCSLS